MERQQARRAKKQRGQRIRAAHRSTRRRRRPGRAGDPQGQESHRRLCIFRFDIDEIERALAAAVQRGVRVRALIAHTNRGGENRLRKLEQRLLAAGVTVSRTADDLLRYHAKFMVADDMLHVFGFNFTKLDILKSRSFAVATRDRRAVLKPSSCSSRCHPSDLSAFSSHLVVSPETAGADRLHEGSPPRAGHLRRKGARPRDDQAPEGARAKGVRIR